MAGETEMGGPDERFQPTAWTLVREAKEGSGEALDRLLAGYWKPVYFFVRRRGHDVETAKDLTQAFFATFVEKEFVKDVSADRGRFRTFLLAALAHFLSNEYDRANAKKRGGGIDFVQAETDLASADPSPEKAFRRQWATEILARAMARIRAEIAPEDFALLSGQGAAGLTPTERKSRLHRLRLRLRRRLREEILPSVEREAEAESELRELFSAFS